MKRILILCSVFCFLLLSNGAMAQCSAGSNSASCYCPGGTYSPQGQWIIASGVPVTVSVDFYIGASGHWVGAEVDLGGYTMDYYYVTTVGQYLDTRVYPASDNDNGNLYLAIGTSSNASGRITASW